jgi:hypothetical protein
MPMWKRHSLLRNMVRVLCVLCFLAFALWFKVAYHSRQEYARGAEAYQRRQYRDAIMFYERAIKWYTPFSSTVQQAVESLWNTGTDAEQRGDALLALEAFRSLRSSLYAVQSVYLPYQSWIPKSEEKIAALMAKTAHPAGRDTEKQAGDTARFAQMLQRNIGPDLGGSILVEIGFLGWVGTTIGFIWQAFGGPLGWRRRQGLLWGSCLVVFFAVWIVGMLLA